MLLWNERRAWTWRSADGKEEILKDGSSKNPFFASIETDCYTKAVERAVYGSA
jgi:hypothetical protein